MCTCRPHRTVVVPPVPVTLSHSANRPKMEANLTDSQNNTTYLLVCLVLIGVKIWEFKIETRTARGAAEIVLPNLKP